MRAARVTMTLLVLAAVALAACYETPKPACSFLCGPAPDQCPDGYFCATDGICKRDGVADDLECGLPTAPDAAVSIDGAAFDASPFDASPFDASPFDAAAFDAAAVDGAAFDASPFDAAP